MLSPIACDDQLPAFVEWNAFLLTVRREKLIALPRQLGLQTVGRVIEPGVQDPTIPAACMESAIHFFLDETHRGAGKCAP